MAISFLHRSTQVNYTKANKLLVKRASLCWPAGLCAVLLYSILSIYFLIFTSFAYANDSGVDSHLYDGLKNKSNNRPDNKTISEFNSDLEIETNTKVMPLKITPYRATYNVSYNSINSTVERTLKKTSSLHWELSNSLSLFFFGFDETSNFRQKEGKITPLLYHLDNELSSKRSSKLSFNWSASTAWDSIRKQTFPLPPGTQDSLSFQLQLRYDLMNNDGKLFEKEYHLIDNKRLKTYRVKQLKEEWITTAAGKFLAIKLEQRREGKSSYTNIWLAKEIDYFLLRLERIKDKKANYFLELLSARINGRSIAAINGDVE